LSLKNTKEEEEEGDDDNDYDDKIIIIHATPLAYCSWPQLN